MLGYRDRYRKERLQFKVDELKAKGALPDTYSIDSSFNLMPGENNLSISL